MAPLLFLTKDEQQKIFEKLPEAIRDAWKSQLREETIDAYESAEELEKRLQESELGKDSHFQNLIEEVTAKIIKGESIDEVSLDDIPSDLVPDFLYSVGANGTSALLEMILQNPQLSPDDMEGVAALSCAPSPYFAD